MGYPPSPPTWYHRSLMWPVVLIALGVLFLLQELVPWWGFSRTWPALLILIGLVKLVDAYRPPRPPEAPRV